MKKYFRYFFCCFMMTACVFVFPNSCASQDDVKYMLPSDNECQFETFEIYACMNRYFISAIYKGFEKKKGEEEAFLQFDLCEQYYGDSVLTGKFEVEFYPYRTIGFDWIRGNPKEDIPYVEGEKYLILLNGHDVNSLGIAEDCCIPYDDIYSGYIFGYSMSEFVSGIEITKETTAEELICHIVAAKDKYMESVSDSTYSVNEAYLISTPIAEENSNTVVTE